MMSLSEYNVLRSCAILQFPHKFSLLNNSIKSPHFTLILSHPSTCCAIVTFGSTNTNSTSTIPWLSLSLSSFQGPFGLRQKRGVEESRVEFAKNRLILGQFYSTFPPSPSIQIDHQLFFFSPLISPCSLSHFFFPSCLAKSYP